MKNKRQINKLAKEVAKLEKVLQDNDTEDKVLQSAFLRIEEIMESLSVEESLELDVAVRKLLETW